MTQTPFFVSFNWLVEGEFVVSCLASPREHPYQEDRGGTAQDGTEYQHYHYLSGLRQHSRRYRRDRPQPDFVGQR